MDYRPRQNDRPAPSRANVRLEHFAAIGLIAALVIFWFLPAFKLGSAVKSGLDGLDSIFGAAAEFAGITFSLHSIHILLTIFFLLCSAFALVFFALPVINHIEHHPRSLIVPKIYGVVCALLPILAKFLLKSDLEGGIGMFSQAAAFHLAWGSYLFMLFAIGLIVLSFLIEKKWAHR